MQLRSGTIAQPLKALNHPDPEPMKSHAPSFRQRAADYRRMAAHERKADLREHYLALERHYTALADDEDA